MIMDLSIIIVNFNNPHLLGTCISTIIASNPHMKYEIIIVDNASNYDVKEQIANSKWQTVPISLIQNKTNIGFGNANNKGAEKAKGKYLLFLNTDIEVLDDAINAMYAFIKNQDTDVIVGGKLLNPDKTPQPSAGPFFTIPVVFAMLFLKGDRIGLTRYSPREIRSVDWVSGACFMIKRETFRALDGFDKQIFMYMEEVDLMYRAGKKGIQTIFYSEAQFIHLGAATSTSRTIPILNIYDGLQYFYHKQYPVQDQRILSFLLKTKARISFILGLAVGNEQVARTYREAMRRLVIT